MNRRARLVSELMTALEAVPELEEPIPPARVLRLPLRPAPVEEPAEEVRQRRALTAERLLRHHPLRSLASSRARARLSLGLLCAAAVVLRLLSSGQDLRLDEAQTIQFAAHPLTGTATLPSLFVTTAADFHPPGYLLFMHFWMQAFGTGVDVLRLPSEIAGILCVPAIYLLGTALYGRRTGLISALIGTVSPLWIWHAQEARMYPFILLLVTLSSWLLVTALRRGGWLRLTGFTVVSILATYTHYFAILILLAQVLYILLERRSNRRRAGCALLCVAVVGVVFVPWALVLLVHHHGGSDPTLGTVTLYTPLITLVELVAGYLSIPVMSLVVAAWPLTVLAALGIGVFGGRASSSGRMLWLLFLVPFGLALLLTFAGVDIFSTRYLIVVTPALYVMIARALGRGVRHDVRAAAVALLTAALLCGWLVQSLSDLNPSTERYAPLVAAIEVHAGPDDAVLLDSGYGEFPYAYYSDNNLPAYVYPAPDGSTATAAELAQYLTSISAGRRHLWVLYDLDTTVDPTQRVRTWLDDHTAGRTVVAGGGFLRDQPGNSASEINVQLVCYDLIPTPSPSRQNRPLTVADLRALTQVSPSERHPFAAPTSSPGSVATMIGAPVAPAAQRESWAMPALDDAATASDLALENANPAPLTVTLSRAGAAPRQLRVAAQSELDVAAAAIGGPVTGAYTLTAPAPFVAARDLDDGHRSVRIYGDA